MTVHHSITGHSIHSRNGARAEGCALCILAATDRLIALEHAFAEAGGRGVELAEEIDALRVFLDEPDTD